MHAIKDRVSDKLSRFFSDSPSSHQPLDQESVASPQAKDGKSLSSKLAFILPSPNFDWFRPNANNEVKPLDSHSFKWRSKSFSLKDKPLDTYTEGNNEYETKENIKSHEENGKNHQLSNSHLENEEPGSGTSTSSGSDVFEDSATPNTFEKKSMPSLMDDFEEKAMPSLMDESLFISRDLYQFLEASLPNIVKGCQWVLLYSTVRHGISLRTLIRKSADLSGPCLLITGDKQGAVFGGLLDCPLKPTAKRKYQGTNQSFIFTTIYGEPRLFRPTGANRYFYLCLNDLLALGGGSNFALCLNEDLLSGTSGPCETFGNMCLAHDQEFQVKNVEVMNSFICDLFT
ncbi:hypothetical protein BUALT_Bualt15G0027000 [Buddleja alternifolia]|uniref:TLDc domain-containing protein n=1 Tax=Buddleja alternifolia TaxID=168488 RepID=A0AAV6WIM3_9LAMI|nr:hypothetical protein BUALT_Bualt15G0027000 [Buddleja alternifolia]